MQNRFEELKNDLLPRFWDTENKEMIYPEYVFSEQLNIHSIWYEIIVGKDVFDKDFITHKFEISDLLFNPRFIPMKPTGLKDKNGKLIYDGDVVRFNENDIGYVVGGVRGYCYDVICPQKQSYGSTLYHIQQYHHIEVIGNIHSNPELLEEQKWLKI